MGSVTNLLHNQKLQLYGSRSLLCCPWNVVGRLGSEVIRLLVAAAAADVHHKASRWFQSLLDGDLLWWIKLTQCLVAKIALLCAKMIVRQELVIGCADNGLMWPRHYSWRRLVAGGLLLLFLCATSKLLDGVVKLILSAGGSVWDRWGCGQQEEMWREEVVLIQSGFWSLNDNGRLLSEGSCRTIMLLRMGRICLCRRLICGRTVGNMDLNCSWGYYLN